MNEVYASALAKELSARYIKLDSSKEIGWKLLKAAVDSEFGRLDGLVNNAGYRFIYGDTDNIETLRPEAFRDISEALLSSTFLGCKYGLQMMKPLAIGMYL